MSTATARPGPQGNKRAGMLAKMACVGCRRLKMKCIIEDGHRSCQRCAKSGKPCVLPLTQHTRKHDAVGAQQTPPLTPATQAMLINPEQSLWSPLSQTGSPQVLNFSTFSDARTDASVPATNSSHISASQTHQWSSPVFQVSESPVGTALSAFGISLGDHGTSDVPEPISKQIQAPLGTSSKNHRIGQDELVFLVKSFINNLLSQVLILDEGEIGTFPKVADNKRPLALSMAYVAAYYVPGCKALRSGLELELLPIATLRSIPGDRVVSDEDLWTVLQSLAVLYTWAPPQADVNVHKDRVELTRDILQASIEALTRRLHLHKSGQEVAELSRHMTVEDLRKTFAFKKYLFRLWFFTSAQIQSVTSRAPPSMREDSSILRASQILRPLVGEPAVQRLLARVELCLVWTRAKLVERDFGDWWCMIPNDHTNDSAITMLGELDSNLTAWRHRWCTMELHASLDLLSKLEMDLYQHFMHLCNAKYISQAFKSSAASRAPSNNFSFDVTVNERAKIFCRWLCELSPLSRSMIVYGSQDLFSAIAFVCQGLLTSALAAKGLEATNSEQARLLDNVAKLLINLGNDDTQTFRKIGYSLIAMWETTTQRSSRPPVRQTPDHHRPRSRDNFVSTSNRQQVGAMHRRGASLDNGVFVNSNLHRHGFESSGSRTTNSHSPETSVMLPLDQFSHSTWSSPEDAMMHFDLPDVNAAAIDAMMTAPAQNWNSGQLTRV